VNIFTLIYQKSEIQPEQLAYSSREEDARLTYRELVARAEKTAAWLIERGCNAGDRCGLMLDDGGEFLTTALGILAAGLCLVPIATFLPEEELDHVLGTARLHWLYGRDRHLVRTPYAGPIDGANDEEFRRCDPAYIRFTSGTTGRRKGILLGHRTIIDRLNAANEVLRIDSNDLVWFALPMVDHFIVSILLYLSQGATILDVSKTEDALTFANLSRPTVIYGAPGFFETLIHSETASLDRLRLAISTTAPLPSRVAAGFAARFGKSLNPALGIIEVGLLSLNTRPEKIGSVGRPMPAYAITLVAEDGKQAQPGRPGELHVKGPGLLDAYIGPWRPALALLTPYGYATGDFARIDAEGYLFLAGRGKNRLLVNGIEFFCEEVETVLNSLPGVAESRVFVDRFSQTLSAELVGSPGPTERLVETLKGLIDSRKVPKSFVIVRDLPRTPNGKLRRG
jgi:long-chain acyl-CoA synthetase